ncbi:MAG TPA: RNA methyltransferase [Thermoleophilaceae bacterium]|nr:RNA methyltransferase [Thermoleophilaceae bacterium]
MITSADNTQLKLIRKLQRKRGRDESGLFVAEGEDLVEAAAAGGWDPEVLLVAGEDVEPELLDRVSSLGSGSRVVGVYRQRWAEPGGALSLYLHGVGDPGNVGTAIRSAHALCDGPVVLGPGCADPFSPKAVRAAMGSLFARPPARAEWGELRGFRLALHGPAEAALSDLATQVKPPVVLCVGAEREGLPEELVQIADAVARIPLRDGGPESLNVAMAATVGLYELGNRMPADG